MAPFFQQVFTLLTTNPGNLAYHLVLAFSIAGALQAALNLLRGGSPQTARRMVTGLGLLLILRLVLFIAAGLSWENVFPAALLMPLLDRAAALLSLLIIIWLWAFPKPKKSYDTATLITGLLIVTLVVTGLLWWNQQPQPPAYNGSLPDIVGEGFAVMLAALGILVLGLRRPEGWGLGLGMLALLLAGHIAHLISPLPPGDLAGAVRLAQLAAYPLLFALPQRAGLVQGSIPQIPATVPAAQERSPQVLDQQFLRPFFNLAAAHNYDTLYPAIARLVARLTVADVCLVVSVMDQREPMLVRAGYNLNKEEELNSTPLVGQLAYTVANALRRGRPIRLPASSTAGEDLGLGTVLGITRLGHLMAAPILSAERATLAGIILLAPYSNRGWTVEDQTLLVSLTELLGQVLQRADQVNSVISEASLASAALAGNQTHVEQLKSENELLLTQLETIRHQAHQATLRAESLAALVASNEENTGIIQRQQRELVRAQEELASLSEQLQAAQSPAPSKEVEYLEAELRLALEEVAHLKSTISISDRKSIQAQDATLPDKVRGEHLAAVISAVTELRQPMSSIIGYTDLLLGETMGILGASQRKFLERINTSIERMGALVEDIIQLSLNQSSAETPAHNVDINDLIDEAIAITIGQMREKNILLRVDIPQHLPAVRAERDALQQILVHLLQNASTATPIEGEVSLHARVRDDDGRQDYILLQVSDRGGGIAQEDMPRVFSRLYRPENTAVPGTGDSGIGLSIVKSLVEANEGRIWVDSESKKGSTFSVLLPIAAKPVSNNGAGGYQE